LFKTGLTICQTGFHTDWYHEVLRLFYCHGVILHSQMVHTQLTNILKQLMYIRFKYEENVLEIVSKFTYLGIVFTTVGYFNTFFEMLAGQALKDVFKLKSNLLKFPGITIQHKLDLFNTFILPILYHVHVCLKYFREKRRDRKQLCL